MKEEAGLSEEVEVEGPGGREEQCCMRQVTIQCRTL